MIIGILDNVRARILDMALSLEEVAPTAGDSHTSAQREAISQIYHTHIHGTSGNVAIGSSNFKQTAILPARGDEEALIRALAAAGVDPQAVADLRRALDDDRKSNGGTDPSEPGPEVSKWWSRVALRTVGGVGVGAAGELVAQSLGAYFGIG
jgi:hypothetical protein